MNYIPDYAIQVTELMHQLEAQAAQTAADWSDTKRCEYYADYVEPYLKDLDTYIHGGSDMKGKGLNDLLQFVADKVGEFEYEAGMSVDANGYLPESAPVYLPGTRAYWEEDYDLDSPGAYSPTNLKDILKKRNNE